MRPRTISQTGVGVTNPFPVDYRQNEFNVGLGAVVTGTATYTVQATFDDIYDPSFNPATATWFDHPVLQGLSANEDDAYTNPIRALRLNVTAGTGTVDLTILQGSPR